MKFQINNSVTDCPYIDDILFALKNVDSKYALYPYDKNVDGTDKCKYPERVFAYEFYHQYRRIMECKKECYCNLYLNGEQPKSSQIWKGLATITPDLVLHGKINEADHSSTTQKWLCEIKMNENLKLTDDLIKKKKKESVLLFQDYILLCVGITKDILISRIDKKELTTKNVDVRTICICVDYGEKMIISSDRLFELMKDNDSKK